MKFPKYIKYTTSNGIYYGKVNHWVLRYNLIFVSFNEPHGLDRLENGAIQSSTFLGKSGTHDGVFYWPSDVLSESTEKEYLIYTVINS